MDSFNSPTTKAIYHGTQAIWYLVGLLEALLIFRFALKLFGANPGAGFTSFIYNISYPFVAPFINVFRVSYVEGSVFEWTTFLAMFVYYLVAIAIVRLFLMGKTVSTPQAAIELENEENQ
jgi:hypothetical protein